MATIRRIVGGWEAVAAFVCLAGGLFAALLGSVLTAITWIAGADAHPWVRGVGTTFLVITIPLLILAGYCLDWAERRPRPRARSQEHNDKGVISIGAAWTFGFLLLLTSTAAIPLSTQLRYQRNQSGLTQPSGTAFSSGKGSNGSRTQTFYHWPRT